MNPHDFRKSTDFKSVASTIPPYPLFFATPSKLVHLLYPPVKFARLHLAPSVLVLSKICKANFTHLAGPPKGVKKVHVLERSKFY